MIRVPGNRRMKAEPVEPTEGERKNGWDAQSLGRYLAERGAAHREPSGRGVVRVEGGFDNMDPRDW